MKNIVQYEKIKEELKKHQYWEKYNLHVVLCVNGIINQSTRYRMINAMIEAGIIEKEGNVFKVKK